MKRNAADSDTAPSGQLPGAGRVHSRWPGEYRASLIPSSRSALGDEFPDTLAVERISLDWFLAQSWVLCCCVFCNVNR